jgi:hypothetical protein
MSEQPQAPPGQIPVQLEDLYKIIGEREVLRYYQQKEMDRLMSENDQLKKMLEPKTAAPTRVEK